jgi:hypothetical protein
VELIKAEEVQAMFGRRFGILWILLALLVAAGVGVFAYQAGLAVNVSHVQGAAPPYAYYGYPGMWAWGFGFGAFHLIGLLLFVLVLVFLFRLAFRSRRWGGWGGYGGYGQGPWQGSPPPFIQERFDEMHRRSHGEAAAPPGEEPKTV